MMFPIYEVKQVGDKWAVLEVYAYKTKTHSDGYDTEADAFVVAAKEIEKLEVHMEALRRGPGANGREGRAVEASVEFGEPDKLIEVADKAIELEDLTYRIERQFRLAEFEQIIKVEPLVIEDQDLESSPAREECEEARRKMILQVLIMAGRAGLVLVEKGGS